MRPGANGGALYHGRVMHARLRPKAHRLDYGVFSMLLDLDRLDGLSRKLKFFSRGRFNLFSFHDRDYGSGAPNDIAAHIRGVLADHGVRADGRILLLCYPRMLGYAFNPLAVYYCHDRTDRLSAIVYEVRNTFGGKHSYLIPVEDEGADIIRQSADKAFHVSPFMEMATRYHFRLAYPREKVSVAIRQTDAGGPVFYAAFAGKGEAMSDATLMRAFVRYPLMTLKVIVGIHWEALRLLAKGMKLLKGAPDPANPVTFVAPGPPPQARDAA